MKTQPWLTTLKTVWVAILVVSCQQQTLDIARVDYQNKATDKLRKLTESYSRALKARKVTKTRGLTCQIDTNPPTPLSCPVEPSGSYVPCQGIGCQFPPGGGTFDGAGYQCQLAIQNIPETAETFDLAMVRLARCLNVLISQQRNFLPRLYQQGTAEMQNRWAYSLDYQNLGSYQQFSAQDFSRIDPYAASGQWQQWLQGQ